MIPLPEVRYIVLAWAPCYRVGDDGSVWSRLIMGCKTGRLGDWKRLSPAVHKTRGGNYLRVTLRVNGRSQKRYVHHLVLEAFVGPCPDGLEGCHRDGNPSNNRLGNLRWDTHQSNVEDTMSLDRVPKGSRHHASTLTEADVLELLEICREIPAATQTDLGILFGVRARVIGPILRGENWGWLTKIEPKQRSQGRPKGRPQLRKLT